MKSSFVAIIDAGIGNVLSVQNALKILSVDSIVSSDPKVLQSASHLILPGVGSFSGGMEGLEARGLVEVIQNEARSGKRILGICLGMQLLASEGTEHKRCKGLDIIPGIVEKIKVEKSGLRLPHIGWNDVRITGDHSIVQGFTTDPIFYFVHSYCFMPEDNSVIAGVTDYGYDITAVIEQKNVFGAQFHPEKSHSDGLHILRNFLEIPHA